MPKIRGERLKMAVNLKKGQKVDLTKGRKNLKNIIVGLGWDTNKYKGSYDFDLDAEVFMLNSDNKVSSDDDFIFYNNLEHRSKSVKHMGDNLTGGSEGDDEQIKINLSKVPKNIYKIAFTVTIYEAEKRKQNFGQVSNAYINIMDDDSGDDLVRYDLGEEFSDDTAVLVGELYRAGDTWNFNASGTGYRCDLRVICLNFGVNV